MNRLRRNSKIRDSVSQTKLSADDLIMPYFVIEGQDKKEPIASMAGMYRLSVDNLVKDIKECKESGIKAVLLFGVSKKKDLKATEAFRKEAIVQSATKVVKKNIKDIIVITDVCLCAYTSHGHCGIIKQVDGLSFMVDGKQKRSYKPSTINDKPELDNDETLKILAKIALSHAQAGADFVAPSAMMDGQVGAIREILDKNGFHQTGILAYSVKYASGFYQPFREALDSAPEFGDRKGYQMDFRNKDEALREIQIDIEEGADIVMVKPALAYLDIVQRVKQNFNIPLAAYNVSGEYAMVKAYTQRIETRNQRTETREQRTDIEKNIILEILTSIKRAGADLIISYHAKEAAKWLMVDSV